MRFIGVYDYTVILTYLSLFSAFGGMTFASRGMFNGAILCLRRYRGPNQEKSHRG